MRYGGSKSFQLLIFSHGNKEMKNIVETVYENNIPTCK